MCWEGRCRAGYVASPPSCLLNVQLSLQVYLGAGEGTSNHGGSLWYSVPFAPQTTEIFLVLVSDPQGFSADELTEVWRRTLFFEIPRGLVRALLQVEAEPHVSCLWGILDGVGGLGTL